MGAPTITTVDGVQWEQNRYATSDGYVTSQYTTAMPVTGVTATAVVQPVVEPNGTNWSSIIDIMYSRVVLAVRNSTGVLRVCENGTWTDGPVVPPAPAKTVLTLVVQPDGKYQVFANGVQVMNVTTGTAITSLDPTWNAGGLGFWSYISVGKNQPDGWTTFNGQIGAAFAWKTALPQGERIAFESELGGTFGITMPVYHTIAASAGVGGTITPSGTVYVLDGADQTFTIAANVGYRIDNVLVDGVLQGALSSYTFSVVSTNHTIVASFAVVPTHTISGRVTDKATGLGISGATVDFSTTPNAFVAPFDTATTNGTGNYTKTLYEGSIYVSATASGYYNSADTLVNLVADTTGVDFKLASNVRHTPVPESLLFSALTDVLPNSGATGNWPTDVPIGGTLTQINNPAVAIIDGQKWDNNVYASGNGYRFNQYSDPIPCTGATIITVVKPTQNAVGTSWTSIVDIFYDRLVLGVRNNTGLAFVRRNGTATTAAGQAIPDGQKTIMSLVVQPDGSYKVYANGAEITFTNNGPITDGFTSLVPGVTGGVGGYGTYVNVGRNNPDGWTVFNGDIGDTFVYLTALTDAQRRTLENDIAVKFGMSHFGFRQGDSIRRYYSC